MHFQCYIFTLVTLLAVLCVFAQIEAVQSSKTLLGQKPFPANVGKWALIDRTTNRSCILLKGAIQLQFVTGIPGGNWTNQSVDVPVNAPVLQITGCGNITQELMITWNHLNDHTNWYNYLLVRFTVLHSVEKSKYVMSYIRYSFSELNYFENNNASVEIDSADLKGSMTYFDTKGSFFPTTLNHSFNCNNSHTILGDLTVRTSSLQFEAFRPPGIGIDTFDDPECSNSTSLSIKDIIPASFPNNTGNWSVMEPSTNKSCILLQGALQLHFENGYNTNRSQVVDVPVDAEVYNYDGTCGDDSQEITLTWYTRGINQAYWFNDVTFNFTLDPNNGGRYVVNKISTAIQEVNETGIDYKWMNKSDASFNIYYVHGPFFSTNLNHSFSCKTMQKMEGSLTILTSDLKFEAFRQPEVERYIFDEPQSCEDDNKHHMNIIPILIGSILSAGVVIILGIYLGVRKGWFSCPCCCTDEYRQVDN